MERDTVHSLHLLTRPHRGWHGRGRTWTRPPLCAYGEITLHMPLLLSSIKVILLAVLQRRSSPILYIQGHDIFWMSLSLKPYGAWRERLLSFPFFWYAVSIQRLFLPHGHKVAATVPGITQRRYQPGSGKRLLGLWVLLREGKLCTVRQWSPWSGTVNK